MQLFFEPAGDVRKHLGFVRLHQQLVAGAGVEFRLNVPDTGVPEALDSPPDSGGALAHRVGVTGEEEKGQVLWHPGQNGGVVQPQDACEHAVVGVQGEGEHAALVGAVLVHFGLVTVEPVLRRAALEAPVVAEEGEVRHQLAAVLPAEKDGQHPAERPGCGDQRFGLEAGTHDDGSVKLIAPLAKVLPGVERAHAVAQQKIGDAGIELLRQRGDSVEIVEDGAVAVGLGEIAVIRLGADGAAVAQMVVAGDEDAPGGQILGQRLVPVDELHHAVGELQDGPHLALRHTAECMERPARYAGGQGEIGHLTHVILLFRLQGSDLGPAGGADAVTLILGHVSRQLTAEIAASGGTVLFEDDLIALHEDLELRVLVDVHIGAQLLGEDDAAQRIDAPNDASCFHIHFSFSVCPERWQNERRLHRHNAKNVPVQEKQENSVNFVPVQYTKS